MHIVFVLRGYPTEADPFQPFSRELISQIAKKGVKCSVIAPQSVTRAIKHKVPIRKTFWKDNIDKDISIDVYQPFFVSTSTLSVKGLKDQRLSAAKKAIKCIKDNIDVVYGHFWDMGVLAAKITENVPVYVGCGEAYIDKIFERFSNADLELLRSKLSGVIYVSTNAYKEACRLELHKGERYLIAPNGYNPLAFSPMNRDECRSKLGLPNDSFIVSFVGSFDDRKGVYRLIEAVKDYPDIKLLLIGRGADIPKSDQILFSGSLPHEKIVTYLNASNVFALPTQAEGCCNAIVEAIACGLPIISSNGEFNDDILDDTNSIRIDPNNMDDIRKAILDIRDNVELRQNLENGSKTRANNLSLEHRASIILDFMSRN